MRKGFLDGFISIGEFCIFSDKANIYFMNRSFQLAKKIFPLCQLHILTSHQVELEKYYLVEVFFFHFQWYLINGIHINSFNDGVNGYITESGYFSFDVFIEWQFGTANQNIRLKSLFLQGFYRMLGGFCHQFPGCFQIGD